jgi:biopolymer transport protein ExbB/TolQ
MVSSTFLLVADSGGLMFAWEHATIAGKILVGILTITSIFSCTVMISKWIAVREAEKQNKIFIKRYRQAKQPLEIYMKGENSLPASPLAQVYYSGAQELTFHLLGNNERDETLAARISTVDCIDRTSAKSVRSAMERTVGEQMLSLESQLILLASAVSGAPFIGLLGTVWGVMDAFTGIAQAGSASLASMAPGVSGALLNTVLGLLVALPAMFGYNFIINTIKSMVVEMENFSAEVASDFEHQFLGED